MKSIIDERSERINGAVSFWVLMLTHIALAGVIVTKRYFLGLPMQETSELSWILGLSIGSYWALRLYFNGVLPVIRLKTMLVIYLGIVALISVPTALIVGLPPAERWFEVLYPWLGVAVVMALYAAIAYFGKKRVEREMGES